MLCLPSGSRPAKTAIISAWHTAGLSNSKINQRHRKIRNRYTDDERETQKVRTEEGTEYKSEPGVTGCGSKGECISKK